MMKQYYDNGKIKYIQEYKNDKKVGSPKWYSETGRELGSNSA